MKEIVLVEDSNVGMSACQHENAPTLSIIGLSCSIFKYSVILYGILILYPSG